MVDIFISYARENHETAHTLARAFKNEGWSIFWDRTIPPGESFHKIIEKNLNDARCILALWSEAASESDWVLDEADYGRAKQILIPVLIEDTKPPIGYRRIQAADLIGWKSEVTHAGYRQLVCAINARLSPPQSDGETLLPIAITRTQPAQGGEKPSSSAAVDEPSLIVEVNTFIKIWFNNFDNHVFAETFSPMIATEDFEMILPEGTARGMVGFREWYVLVTRLFFNESHDVRDVQLSRSGSRIVADVVLTWQAERWPPPEAKSQRLGFDVKLRLEIGRSPTGTLIMLRYMVEELKPLPGSPAL